MYNIVVRIMYPPPYKGKAFRSGLLDTDRLQLIFSHDRTLAMTEYELKELQAGRQIRIFNTFIQEAASAIRMKLPR